MNTNLREAKIQVVSDEERICIESLMKHNFVAQSHEDVFGP